MAFFDFIRKLNPFRAKTSPTEGRLEKLSLFQRMVQASSPVAPVQSSLPTWSEEQLAALSPQTLETPRDALDAFLHFGAWLPVSSSNVDEIRYSPDDSTLQIKFKNGNIYQYDDVSVREAENFANSASKGGWVWDELRLRGTVFGFNRRHPYTFLSGVSAGTMPQWFRSPMTRRLHGKVPDTGAQNKSIFKRLMPKRGAFPGKKS